MNTNLCYYIYIRNHPLDIETDYNTFYVNLLIVHQILGFSIWQWFIFLGTRRFHVRAIRPLIVVHHILETDRFHAGRGHQGFRILWWLPTLRAGSCDGRCRSWGRSVTSLTILASTSPHFVNAPNHRSHKNTAQNYENVCSRTLLFLSRTRILRLIRYSLGRILNPFPITAL